MIDFYTCASPNAYKVSICLEELQLQYRVVPVDLMSGEQRTPAFRSINPVAKIPVIVDVDTQQTIFESGAILFYLAEKAGRLLPAEGKERWEVITWLFFHSATVGPALAQRVNFEILAKEKISSVIERFTNQTEELFRVLDSRLSAAEYLCGDYSIADIAHFGWLHIAQIGGFSFSVFPNLSRWHGALAARPGVQRGLQVPTPPRGF